MEQICQARTAGISLACFLAVRKKRKVNDIVHLPFHMEEC